MIKKGNFSSIFLAGVFIGSLITSTLVIFYFHNKINNLNFVSSNINNNISPNINESNFTESILKPDLVLNETKIDDYDDIDDKISYQEITLNRELNNKNKKKIIKSTSTKIESSNDNNQKINNNQKILANLLLLLANLKNNKDNSVLNNSTNSAVNNQNNQNNQQNNNQVSNSNNSQNNSSSNNNQNINNNRTNNNNSNNNNYNNQQNNNDNENNEINGQASGVKILISEVMIDGGNANDEYIELYNPNNFEVNLSGWKLIKINKNGNQQTLIGLRTRNTFNGKIIRPYSYFLIANEDSNYTNQADLTYSGSYNLAKDNSVILLNNNNEIVDLIGWGEAIRYENIPFRQNPSQNTSLVRKAGYESNSQTMISRELNFGNSLDTDNNSFDFILMNPEPQNSNSQPEIPPAEISLINFEENENNLIFEIISPYQKLSNSFYKLIAINSSDLEENQNIENYLRNNWQNLIVDYNLPNVESYGKYQRIEINLNNSDEDNIYLLLLIKDNQLINWVPDLND